MNRGPSRESARQEIISSLRETWRADRKALVTGSSADKKTFALSVRRFHQSCSDAQTQAGMTQREVANTIVDLALSTYHK